MENNETKKSGKKTVISLIVNLYKVIKTTIIYYLLPYKLRRYRFRILDIIDMGISQKPFRRQLLFFKLHYIISLVYLIMSSYLAYNYISNSKYIDYEIIKFGKNMHAQKKQHEGLAWMKPLMIQTIEEISDDTKIDLKAFLFLLSASIGISFLVSTIVNRRIFYARETKLLKRSLVRYGIVKEDEIKENNSFVTPVGLLIDAQDKTKEELKKNEVFWKQMGVTPGDVIEHPTYNSYYFIKSGLKLGDTKEEVGTKWVYDFTKLK